MKQLFTLAIFLFVFNTSTGQQWVWDSIISTTQVFCEANNANNVFSYTRNGHLIAGYGSNGQLLNTKNISGNISKVRFDTNNNMYVIGSFTGSISEGSITLTSYGEADIFFAKYNPVGQALFFKQIGSIDPDGGGDVSFIDGKIYVTGGTRNNTWFDQTLISKEPYGDFFLARFDANGNFEKVKFAIQSQPSIYQGSTGMELCGDGSGNINVLATTLGNSKIDTNSFGGSYAYLILRFDSTLSFVNKKWIASGLGLSISDLKCNSVGELIYVIYETSHYFEAGTIEKLSADLLSKQTLYYDGVGNVGGIDLDSYDNIYFTGYHSRWNFSNNPPGKCFFKCGKMGPAGNLLWMLQDSSISYRVGLDVSMFSSGTCFVMGMFQDTLVLKNTLISPGVTSCFLSILNPALVTTIDALNHDGTAFQVYPNPSTGVFSVNNGNSTVELYDINGRLIFSSTNKHPNQQVDLTKYPSGVYVLKSGTRVQKIIKEN